MKIQFFLVICIMLIMPSLYAQSQAAEKIKTISVTGSAEMNVKPDQLDVEITIREYMLNKVDKFSLDNAQSEFAKVLAAHGLDSSDIILDDNSLFAAGWQLARKRKLEPISRMKYVISIDSSFNLAAFVNDLNRDWVEDVQLAGLRNSRSEEYRRQVKIQAIKAAKEKATYLLESIDEKLGEVLEVVEMDNAFVNYLGTPSAALSNTMITPANRSDDIQNTRFIRIRYEIKAEFRIK